MKYIELFKEENEAVRERYEMSMERIRELRGEETIPAVFLDYFRKTAEFILLIEEAVKVTGQDGWKEMTAAQLADWNRRLYADVAGAHYETSYANPAYAVRMLGEVYGGLLSFLYTEIRGMIVYAFEYRLTDITIYNELFIQIYNLLEEMEAEEDITDCSAGIRDAIYWFVSDYSDYTLDYRVREQLDPELSFAVDLICRSDLSDVRYLYQFGEYITENELGTSRFLSSLSEEEIQKMADTFTEGFRMGFVNGRKDLSRKKVVNIRYTLGFERVIKKAIANFEALGLKPVIYRAAVSSIHKKQQHKIGYFSTSPNKQYDYDHKDDNAIYLDKKFVTRKLGVLKMAYEHYKELAEVHAGPAVLEIFGEHPFAPKAREEAFKLSEKQQKLSVEAASQAGQLVNQYIKGEERSFTIMAFPIPEIGAQFAEIFGEVVKLNTLDYALYQRIQQTMIDALDQGERVHIKGKGANKTDLTVALQSLSDPKKESKFENCVADVNIPVGEVFTSPKLAGTEGTLHVTQVYLNELNYKDLTITFADGMITGYTCGNFDTEEENQAYLKETVLFHHETLPMGEFAIGTNTTAYVMAEKYQIADKLPILIAEKMGPHFAVGDTCYSWSEDTRVYNPDGKEIIAKDNACSVLRKEDPGKAYFNCHTDITIPYEELEHIQVLRADGSIITILQDGRFVLPGTEELNAPFAI